MARLIYVYSELPSYVRVKKNLTSFSLLCSDVLYIGANRNNLQWRPDTFPSNVRFKIYDKKISHGGLGSIAGTFGFAIYVIKCILAERPDVIVFANEELVWTKIFVRRRVRIVCEILDSLAIRTTGLLSSFSGLFRLYCSVIYRYCDALVEVSNYRVSFRKYAHRNLVVIPNTPLASIADTRGQPPGFLRKLRYVYISGSVLPDVSGVEKLLEALEIANLPDLKIVYSGRLEGTWAQETIFSHRHVINLGCLDPEDSLDVASGALAIFAFYKPINMNYVLASPNKIADAIYLKRRVIINSECYAASYIAAFGLALECAFDDVQALANILRDLFEGRSPPVGARALDEFYRNNLAPDVILRRWQQVLLPES